MTHQAPYSEKQEQNTTSGLVWNKKIIFGGVFVGLATLYCLYRNYTKEITDSSTPQSNTANSITRRTHLPPDTSIREFDRYKTFTCSQGNYIDFKLMISDGTLSIESFFENNRHVDEYNSETGFMRIESAIDESEEFECYNISIDANDKSDDFS